MEQDPVIQKIKEFFKVPEKVADKVQNIVEKVKGDYILIEIRPRWDGSLGPWTKLPVAKISYNKSSKSWRVYWMRASERWQYYPTKVKTLVKILEIIKRDKQGCFWG